MTEDSFPSPGVDGVYMQRCLELARQALGRTAPNPLVGCVVVQGDRVVGEGFHPAAGQPHAEVFALRAAGTAARGATLYVNLEPCNHTGRTPPCTEAVLAAGVRRVVVGMVDPNPLVAGQGLERLRSAGLAVGVGVEEADCQRLNEAFVHRITHQKPFGIFKYAMTLDGKIAASSGHSAWVSSPASRQRVHQLRSACDAVIVGGNTVRRDNPRLTTHGQSEHQPLRVVLSRGLDLPREANLWQTAIAPTRVYTGPQADPAMAEYLSSQDVEVVTLSELTPTAVWADLYGRGHMQVLWECGGHLGAAAIASGCVQKLWAFVAPKLIGGRGPSPVGELGLTRMDEAIALEHYQWDKVGGDLWIEGYLQRP